MDEKQGEIAFNLNKQIVANELQRRELLGQNVFLLKRMKEDNLFQAVLGDEKAEWVAYLGSLEVFYSRNEIYNFFRIYDKFKELDMEYKDVADIPTSRLMSLLSIITKENMEDVLGNARILTRRDFSDFIKEHKGLPTTDMCEHDYKKQEVCKNCGEKHEI